MSMRAHPFTLRQLQYAVAVAETLSFRRAAELCNVSQPSLSAQLAQLEDVLGARLFERDQKRVLLTAKGEELIERAKKILLETDDLWTAAGKLRDPRAGTLKIGVIPTISPYLLPPITPALKKKFPRLRFAWTEEKTETLNAWMADGVLDAAILALEAELGDLETEIIAKDPFMLVTPPNHPLAADPEKPATPRELEGESVLLLDDGHCFRTQALAVCSAAKIEELEFRATSLSTLVQMVAAGNGITLLPALSVPTEVKRANLRVRAFKKPAPSRTIALVWRKRSPLFDVFREIAAVLKASYPGAA